MRSLSDSMCLRIPRRIYFAAQHQVCTVQLQAHDAHQALAVAAMLYLKSLSLSESVTTSKTKHLQIRAVVSTLLCIVEHLDCKAILSSHLSVDCIEGLIFFSSSLPVSLLNLPLNVAPLKLDASPFHVCLNLLKGETPGCQSGRFHQGIICLSLSFLLLDLLGIHCPHLLAIFFVTLQSSR